MYSDHNNDPKNTAYYIKAYLDRKHTVEHCQSWIGLRRARIYIIGGGWDQKERHEKNS